MPFITFTVSNSYSLSTHYVEFDHTNLYIKLSSNNSTVATFALTSGIDIRVHKGAFQTGTIVGLGGSFNRFLDFTLTNASITYDGSTTKIIGTNDDTDTSATKYLYTIGNSNCPIRIIKNSITSEVTITCPCDLSNCSTLNSSFQQIN